MDKARLILALCAFLMLAACNQVKKEAAIEYNDFLNNTIDPVVSKMLDFEEAIYTGDRKKLYVLHAELVKFTHETRLKIIEKPAFDGNEALKNAILLIADFYKSIAENDYHQIIKIIESQEGLTQEKADEIEKIISKIYDKENEYYNLLENETSAYSKKYNIAFE